MLSWVSRELEAGVFVGCQSLTGRTYTRIHAQKHTLWAIEGCHLTQGHVFGWQNEAEVARGGPCSMWKTCK